MNLEPASTKAVAEPALEREERLEPLESKSRAQPISLRRIGKGLTIDDMHVNILYIQIYYTYIYIYVYDGKYDHVSPYILTYQRTTLSVYDIY